MLSKRKKQEFELAWHKATQKERDAIVDVLGNQAQYFKQMRALCQKYVREGVWSTSSYNATNRKGTAQH